MAGSPVLTLSLHKGRETSVPLDPFCKAINSIYEIFAFQMHHHLIPWDTLALGIIFLTYKIWEGHSDLTHIVSYMDFSRATSVVFNLKTHSKGVEKSVSHYYYQVGKNYFFSVYS